MRLGLSSLLARHPALSLVLLASAGSACGSDKACPEIACPSVGEEAATGDYLVPLGGNDHWSTVDLSYASMTSSPAFSEFSLLGGELVFTNPICSTDGTCRTSMKKLRLDLAPFSIGFSDGRNVSYDALSVSFEMPISIEGQDGQYAIPVGTETHTCARVNARSWHAAATSSVPNLINIDVMQQLLEINGEVPLVVRADDAGCTTVALEARVVATPTLPWTLVVAEGGDAAP